MERHEDSRQVYLDYRFSRLNAAFQAFVKDKNHSSRARWWHKNLHAEIVRVLLDCGVILIHEEIVE